MGHHCHECGTKLVGGLTPTTCDCIECYCGGCWDALFECKYVELDAQLYTKDGNPYPKKIYQQTEVNPKCPECGKVFEQDKCRDY